MHVGITDGPNRKRPWAMLGDNRSDGATSADGRIMGSYIHGALASTDLRSALLHKLGACSDEADHAAAVDSALDAIAAELESHLDIDALLALTTAGTSR
jgi:adenosylcobyric acid synthase